MTAVIDREAELGWPNGLAVDHSTQRLWWADAQLDRIQHARLDGTDVVTMRHASIVHPFGLAVDASYVYFADWRNEGIMRLNKTGAFEPTLL